MAKVNYIEIPLELQEKYGKFINPQDRYYFARKIKKSQFLSRHRLNNLKSRTLLPQIKTEWNAFNTDAKNAWKAAGAACGLTGYQTYVQDKTLRLKNDLEGNSTPSTMKQGWVGEIVLDYPDSEIKLFQAHPINYWIQRKIVGTKNSYGLFNIDEILTLPLEIGISYRSDLTDVDEPYTVEFYAEIHSEYQGRTITTKVSLDFDLVSDWQRATRTVQNVRGVVRSYALYIHLKGVIGKIQFDNILAEHTGQNWARDPKCNKIEQIFTRQYFNVPKHWVAEEQSENSDYYSVFHAVEF
jgi:hypothetical protein